MNRIHDHYLSHQKLYHDPARQDALTGRRAARARRNIRIAILAFHRWIERFHPQCFDAATLLDLKPRTIARWKQHWTDDKLRSKPHGRPRTQSQVTDRRQVYQLLDALGPHVGCPTLEVFFPLMARRELKQLLQRYRYIWRKQ